MSHFSMTSSSPAIQWLVFFAILLGIGLAITGFIAWIFGIRKLGKPAKKKRKRKHGRQSRTNPTLAQSGGLPPVRDPDQPPKAM